MNTADSGGDAADMWTLKREFIDAVFAIESLINGDATVLGPLLSLHNAIVRARKSEMAAMDFFLTNLSSKEKTLDYLLRLYRERETVRTQVVEVLDALLCNSAWAAAFLQDPALRGRLPDPVPHELDVLLDQTLRLAGSFDTAAISKATEHLRSGAQAIEALGFTVAPGVTLEAARDAFSDFSLGVRRLVGAQRVQEVIDFHDKSGVVDFLAAYARTFGSEEERINHLILSLAPLEGWLDVLSQNQEATQLFGPLLHEQYWPERSPRTSQADDDDISLPESIEVEPACSDCPSLAPSAEPTEWQSSAPSLRGMQVAMQDVRGPVAPRSLCGGRPSVLSDDTAERRASRASQVGLSAGMGGGRASQVVSNGDKRSPSSGSLAAASGKEELSAIAKKMSLKAGSVAEVMQAKRMSELGTEKRVSKVSTGTSVGVLEEDAQWVVWVALDPRTGNLVVYDSDVSETLEDALFEGTETADLGKVGEESSVQAKLTGRMQAIDAKGSRDIIRLPLLDPLGAASIGIGRAANGSYVIAQSPEEAQKQVSLRVRDGEAIENQLR